MIQFTNLFEEARKLGKEARMNGIERVPIRDKKLMDLIREKTTAKMYLYMKEWLAGWDEVHIKELNAGFDFSTLFNN
jgi:hypothetical protein